MILKPIPEPLAIVIDVDGTAYRFNAEYYKACLAALARTTRFAVSDRFNGRLDEAREFITKHGVHTHAPDRLLRLVSHARDVLTTDFIRPAPALALHLRHIGKPVYAFSNSSPLWIDSVLQKRGLDTVIPVPHRISARADLGQTKRHTTTYERLADRLRIKDRSRILVVDDESENLLRASAAGFSTAAIGDYRPEKGMHYVNAMAPDLKTLLKQLYPLPHPLPAARP